MSSVDAIVDPPVVLPGSHTAHATEDTDRLHSATLGGVACDEGGCPCVRRILH